MAQVRRLPLAELIEASNSIKPGGAASNAEWARLAAYYDDQSRGHTVADLRAMGVGVESNPVPLEMGRLLRQVVDRAATVYKRAPARWLMEPGGKRIAEDDPRHQAMLDAVSRAQYDVAWRLADRKRTLLGQVALRVYPSDHRSAAVLRLFAPQAVHRGVDPACADLMDHDRRFALELDGGIYEVWHRHPDDQAWCMSWTDKSGALLSEDLQPLRTEPDHRSPYAVLPVQMVYADHPGGAPWLPPSQSRQGWVRALNAVAADVHELVIQQAHATRVHKKSNPATPLASATGPSVTLGIDAADDLFDLTPSPAINDCLTVIDRFARFFAISESLPGNEFDPQRQILTGAALRVQLQPLIDRREDQVPLVVPDEQWMWRRLRAVHNVHSSAWGLERLDEDTELDLEVPDIEAPATETERGNASARRLAIGTASLVDLTMEETGATRPEAIKRIERIREDHRLYPPLLAPGALQKGPRMTGVSAALGPTAPDLAPDTVLDGKASVMDALRLVDGGAEPVEMEAQPAVPAGGVSVQDTALNGAQIASGLSIVERYVTGGVHRASAKAMLVAMLRIPADIAEDMLGPADFRPRAAEAADSPPPLADAS